MARPRKYTDEEVLAICKLYEEYIEKTEIPVVAKFASDNKITRQTLYDYPEFATLTKRLIDKKEANLEIMALEGKINVSMAIFSLKQLGWSDKPDTSLSDTEPIIEALRQVLGK